MGRVAPCAAIMLSALTSASQAQTSGSIAKDEMVVVLRPEPSNRDSMHIDRVGVVLRFDPGPIKAGQPLVSLPHVVANVDTFATELAGLRMTDDGGVIALTVRDRENNQGAVDADTQGQLREWIPNRATHGSVTIGYSVPASATRLPRGPAPPIGLMMEKGAFSGTAGMFIPQPTSHRRYRFRIGWDLTALPKGSVGMSSFGIGDTISTATLTAQDRANIFFMAGLVGVTDRAKMTDGFIGGWQGQPAFDAAETLAWTGRLYARFRQFFDDRGSTGYSVFLRHNPINAGGGVALYRSFVATFGTGPGTDAENLKFVLSHEMFHTFQPHISIPDGLESSWFSEGSAVLYQGRLPLRFGMVGSKAYIDDLNFFIGRYYTSIMADQPNAEIAKRFWADTRIRTLPYDRGMLYLAGVDAALRRVSGGKRSLDEIQLAMRAAERAGHANSNADWETMLRRELGPDAVTEFRAFLAGHLRVPPSDAFGPCFRRHTVRLRRYESGFDPSVLAEPRRIVRGLIAGSAAAAAGLRNGDEIVVPVAQDLIQGTQDRKLTLRIRRDDEEFDLSYLPRGETVDAYQWERIPEVPENRCAI